MDSDEEAYILLLLSDGNLPTGSFVASAGLESYVTHGFFTPLTDVKGKATDKVEHIVNYIRDNMASYARSALPFVSDAHRVAQETIKEWQPSPSDAADLDRMDPSVRALEALDDLYEVMTLNHVARRASRTQGVALLTLYTKGFSQPDLFTSAGETDDKIDRNNSATLLVDRLKLMIRREETPGHLPVCWGVLTAALGLSLERSQFLHLFLCARGLLSAAVRMNIIGPYASQQVLLHAVRPIVNAEAAKCAALRTGLQYPVHTGKSGADMFEESVMVGQGPAMTWPLGEILAGRHDLQHSRVFNS